MTTKWNPIPFNEHVWVCLNELGECIALLKIQDRDDSSRIFKATIY